MCTLLFSCKSLGNGAPTFGSVIKISLRTFWHQAAPSTYLRRPGAARVSPGDPMCHHSAAKLKMLRNLWNFPFLYNFWRRMRWWHPFLTKKIFWLFKMGFTKNKGCRRLPPCPPKCRHQVDLCGDQLLSWRCITCMEVYYMHGSESPYEGLRN